MAGPPSTFLLTLRNRIWRVTFDDAFFGDYRTERQAMEGIADAQRKLASPARIVRAEADRP
jgi:hypothetical protein